MLSIENSSWKIVTANQSQQNTLQTTEWEDREIEERAKLRVGPFPEDQELSESVDNAEVQQARQSPNHSNMRAPRGEFEPLSGPEIVLVSVFPSVKRELASILATLISDEFVGQLEQVEA
jgi:hypothetical protein